MPLHGTGLILVLNAQGSQEKGCSAPRQEEVTSCFAQRPPWLAARWHLHPHCPGREDASCHPMPGDVPFHGMLPHARTPSGAIGGCPAAVWLAPCCVPALHADHRSADTLPQPSQALARIAPSPDRAQHPGMHPAAPGIALTLRCRGARAALPALAGSRTL